MARLVDGEKGISDGLYEDSYWEGKRARDREKADRIDKEAGGTYAPKLNAYEPESRNDNAHYSSVEYIQEREDYYANRQEETEMENVTVRVAAPAQPPPHLTLPPQFAPELTERSANVESRCVVDSDYHLQKREEWDIQQEETELDGCTFEPTFNNPMTYEDGTEVESRLYDNAAGYRERKEEAELRKADDAVADCTFSPLTTKKAKAPTAKGDGSEMTAFERNYERARHHQELREAKRAQFLAEEDATMRAKPMITKTAKRAGGGGGSANSRLAVSKESQQAKERERLARKEAIEREGLQEGPKVRVRVRLSTLPSRRQHCPRRPHPHTPTPGWQGRRPPQGRQAHDHVRARARLAAPQGGARARSSG
jgi:hypothetical protein